MTTRPLVSLLLLALLALFSLTGIASAQEVSPLLEQARRFVTTQVAVTNRSASEEGPGIALPNTDAVRVRLRFLAGYGYDAAQGGYLGLESQGRVGYAIVELTGTLGSRLRYVLEVNPVNETEPLPACGQATYFYPNAPSSIGPSVRCDNAGNRRVDDYKFLALDLVSQQGILRQAYAEYTQGRVAVRFGRFLLPLGFAWEDAGSFTAKDATHIQRINAEANFGWQVSWTRDGRAGRFVGVHAGAVIGDGNRVHDYDYFYAVADGLDTNSALTAYAVGIVRPVAPVDLRVSTKYGYTGSKVEGLPNYFASKRNDHAVILSARYRPHPHVALFGEAVRYTWGPTETSADLLGVDRAPIHKTGYYVGGDLGYPIRKGLTAGAVLTYENLLRDDSLVKLLAAQGLYGVRMGAHEKATVLRVYLDVANRVTVGFYRTRLDNPFPWISGILPAEGPLAFVGDGANKWGMFVRMRVN